MASSHFHPGPEILKIKEMDAVVGLYLPSSPTASRGGQWSAMEWLNEAGANHLDAGEGSDELG